MKISKELKMGVFAIAIIAIAYWGINFLKGMDVLSPSYTYYAYYDNSSNVEISAPILIKGMNVGSVVDISIDDVDSKVKMTLRISKKYKLPANTEAVISSTSMLGGKAIILNIGNSTEILESHDEIKGHIDNGMEQQIDDVKESLTDVVAKLTTTLESVNALLSEDNIANISSSLSNVNGATRELNNMLDGGEISSILSNLESVTADLKGASPALGSMITNLDSITSSINDANISATLLSANQTIAELNKTVEQINSGKGSIGSLIYDESLYKNLDQASYNLSELMLDLKERPKRYVHFSIFGRKDK